MSVANDTSTDGTSLHDAGGRDTTPAEPDGSRTPSRALRLPFATMIAAVTTAAALPFLADRSFYLSGDSIAQWLPVNRRIGELLRSGDSHLMDPTLWRGGNFIGEARFGVWNPLTLLIDVAISVIDDLAVAMLLVSLAYLLLLAIGVYFLAREYGAAGWPSAVVGVVGATAGWTLWMDAAWWTPHLASLAFTPFVWIAARRVARSASGPGWLVLAGALCVTAGNPYSNILVLVIVVGVAIEFADRRVGGECTVVEMPERTSQAHYDFIYAGSNAGAGYGNGGQGSGRMPGLGASLPRELIQAVVDYERGL